MSKVIRFTIGDEYDETLKERVFNALAEDGAIMADRSWGVGGSQEIEKTTIRLQGGHIAIESETYIGLTVEGPEHLVCRLIEKLNKFPVTPSVIPSKHK